MTTINTANIPSKNYCLYHYESVYLYILALHFYALTSHYCIYNYIDTYAAQPGYQPVPTQQFNQQPPPPAYTPGSGYAPAGQSVQYNQVGLVYLSSYMY